ncbi:hypothetical protein KDN34_07805 [Shewanella yunxiaonensis]|uniref:Antitermination protein NusG n=1 Tax=Shewanella yunxiaonensis TaxID=2829809 RepID=A0ABX7YWY7_9GAMM|nr:MULTISPECIES: hypothetical protein [Shewanella]MDF0535488.1 hypothetical protein [Shewanella sp. A32]QUN07305.1 hypothetical protein KDN34_07805 [Shewanella yunxiaonensis]
MLTKLLLTVLVVVFAWRMLAAKRHINVNDKVNPKNSDSKIRKYLFSFVLGALALLGSGFMAWQWFDGYTIVTVTLVSPTEARRDVYQVRKKDISANELVTVDGLKIRLSREERLVIDDK